MAAVVWRCFLCVAFKYGVDLNSFPSLHIPPMGYHALFLNLLKLGGVSLNKIFKKEQVGERFKAVFSKALSPDGCWENERWPKVLYMYTHDIFYTKHLRVPSRQHVGTHHPLTPCIRIMVWKLTKCVVLYACIYTFSSFICASALLCLMACLAYRHQATLNFYMIK